MHKYLLIILLASSLNTSAQSLKPKTNHEVFDCEILRTVLSDSTVFTRRNWAKTNAPFIINDFSNYFKNCASLMLYNRPVVLVHYEPAYHSDTTTILYVTRDAPDTCTIDFFQPSSGSDCRIELSKKGNTYKVQKVVAGAY